MRDFVLAYWTFAPYLALLSLLAIMSAREGRAWTTGPATGSRTGAEESAGAPLLGSSGACRTSPGEYVARGPAEAISSETLPVASAGRTGYRAAGGFSIRSGACGG
jgi:hypothetical protein